MYVRCIYICTWLIYTYIYAHQWYASIAHMMHIIYMWFANIFSFSYTHAIRNTYIYIGSVRWSGKGAYRRMGKPAHNSQYFWDSGLGTLGSQEKYIIDAMQSDNIMQSFSDARIQVRASMATENIYQGSTYLCLARQTRPVYLYIQYHIDMYI